MSLSGAKVYSGPGFPMFILFWIYVLYLAIGFIINKVYGDGYECIFDLQMFKDNNIDEIIIKEDLDDYF